ncbi:hypothetical protein chiPu_0024220 [Chiloscyllium punctatum]|uniref:Uncharacterized protein n=1 Tax=Chiloscyllium punctatum TaxID=137246 RepID=A0A401TBP6_CHIPU|nr:hypothetical protein [Chiloscyllium punctatum]
MLTPPGIQYTYWSVLQTFDRLPSSIRPRRRKTAAITTDSENSITPDTAAPPNTAQYRTFAIQSAELHALGLNEVAAFFFYRTLYSNPAMGTLAAGQYESPLLPNTNDNCRLTCSACASLNYQGNNCQDPRIMIVYTPFSKTWIRAQVRAVLQDEPDPFK